MCVVDWSHGSALLVAAAATPAENHHIREGAVLEQLRCRVSAVIASTAALCPEKLRPEAHDGFYPHIATAVPSS